MSESTYRGYFLVEYWLVHILCMNDYRVVNEIIQAECVWVRTGLYAAVLTWDVVWTFLPLGTSSLGRAEGDFQFRFVHTPSLLAALTCLVLAKNILFFHISVILAWLFPLPPFFFKSCPSYLVFPHPDLSFRLLPMLDKLYTASVVVMVIYRSDTF